MTALFGVEVPLIADEAVNPEKGTGVVMCCTFGDTTDIEWWRTHKLPLRTIVDKTGKICNLEALSGPDWPSHDVPRAKSIAAQISGQNIRAPKPPWLLRSRRQVLF